MSQQSTHFEASWDDRDSLDIGVELGPRLVELPVELHRLSLVGRVADETDAEQSGPEEKIVEGEDGSVVQDCPGKADDRGEEAEGGGEGEDLEIRAWDERSA